MSAPAVVIVGAGPAGLSAALTAANAGLQVTVLDERGRPGGRLRYDQPGSHELAGYLAECQRLGVEIRSRTVAWGLFPGWRLALETPNGADEIETDHLILATGATDRALAFEGNTLPGVMTGTALRRLIGEFGVLPGQRCLVLGDGQDAAATAHAVRQAGGQIITLVSEAEARSIVVEGDSGVERVTLKDGTHPVDIVAIAVGRQPDVQLATMGGCELVWKSQSGGWIPRQFETDAAPTGLYIAGDAAGADTIAICELDGAFAATRLAADLGLVDAEAVRASAAAIAQRRPERMEFVGAERLHRQPWQLPIEVNA